MTDQIDESVTLESLAAQFEAPAQSQPVQRDVSQEPPKFEAPEQAIEWLAKQHSETTKRLQEVSEKLSSKEQKEYVDAQMRDLDEAIKTIGKDVEIDPMFIEGALHTTYNRDKNFQKIFDNRAQNPEAYQKALSVISQQLKVKSSVKMDPQLAENSRALEQLQKSARTGAQSSPDDATRNMSASDFDQYWERLKSG